MELEFKRIYNIIQSKRNNQLVILYQMGKVGSQSVKNSILKSGIECIDLFSLRAPTMSYISQNIKYDNNKLVILGEIRQKIYKHALLNNKRKLITIVRDPISRDFSLLYHFLSGFLYNVIGQSTGDEFTLQELIQKIYDEKMVKCSAINWFEHEFNRTLDINIYEYPFYKENGYTRIRHKGLDILVLTMEKLNANQKILGDFLGKHGFTLDSYNRASKKWYSEIHNLTQPHIKLDKEQIATVYNSKYMRHFYTLEDINILEKKWLTLTE